MAEASPNFAGLAELAQVSRQINLARETAQAPQLPTDIVDHAQLNERKLRILTYFA
ncbi:MAG: hypothetical protein I8H79_17245 [Burkholderiales bacterium]|nr:hypothetical protein [Burkholderiales bacterium]MBH1996784.1 hypothetical protein [Burkholderiales bacterium]MBH2071639.1 hypothetical protein [Burkholderiales bacterium]